MPNKTLLPKGYKTVGDKTSFLGKLKDLSPAQEQVRRLMVRDKSIRSERDVENKINPPIPKLKKLSDNISNSIQSQINLRSITPYIKRAEQVWTTLLLTPNGLDQDVLNFNTFDSQYKNAKLHAILLQSLKNHFTTVYPFQEKLPQIIKDVMFRTGSSVFIEFSYPALDHLINGMSQYEGNEDIFSGLLRNEEYKIKNKFFINGDYSKARNLGWVRKEKRTQTEGLESIFKGKDGGEEFNLIHEELGITLTDNPMVIKLADVRSKLADVHLHRHIGSESIDDAINVAFTKNNSNKKKKQKPNPNNIGITNKENLEEFFDRIYPDRKYAKHETLSIRHPQYYTGYGRGEGLTIHVPSESYIPVHVDGEKNNPIGGILLVDPDTGYFLKSTSDILYYSSNKHREERVDNKPKSGSINNLISNIKNIADGKDCNIDMDWVVDFVSGQLEKELCESFINGDKALPVTITLTEANKKIFLARALKQQGVRCVFIPAEYVTYFALDYNELGVGKSLVEEAKMIITRLAILDIADTLANLQNAVPKSLLTIDLEEENFNPTELIIQAREAYLQQNPSLLNYVGFAEIPIDRIIDGIKESLVRIKVNANNNPNIINPNIEESHDDFQSLQPVDNDSREKALNSLASYFDLKRSWLEDSEQGNDFAIEALSDQILLRNITIERSRVFSLHISDHFTKHVYANEYLIKELIDIIVDNKDLYNKPDQGDDVFKKKDSEESISEETKVKLVLKDFLDNLNITLPIPATIETYNKLVDKIDAADKLVNGWKEIGIANSLLERTLKQMNLEDGDETTNSEYIMGIIDSVLRREAYRKLGINIPFDEIVADGKNGGVMTFVNEAIVQRDNVVYFLEALFKQFSKGNSKLKKIGEKYRDGLYPQEEDNNEDNDTNSDDNENNNNSELFDNDNEDNTDNNSDEIDNDNEPSENDTNTESDNDEGKENKEDENGDDNTAENVEEKLDEGLNLDNFKF